MNDAKTLEKLNAMFAKRSTGITKRAIEAGEVAPRLKPIYCADGSSISVQASREHRCFPRTDFGPYERVEVGFPSVNPPESWAEYCLGDFEKKPLDAVYTQIPIELVAQFIDMHGGIKAEEAPAHIVPTLNILKPREGIEQKRYNLTFEDMGLKF